MKEQETVFFTIDNSMILRGIGTLLVVLAHYAQWYITIADSNVIWILLSKVGRYGVGIFFLVSGYGIVCSAEKGLNFHWIKRRILNVYLPYLCIEGIILLLGKTKWTLIRMVRYFFTLDAWFVFVIILFYILFFVVWKYCRQKTLWMIVGVAGISAALFIAMNDSVWYASNIAFLVGVVVAQYKETFFTWIGKREKIYSGILLIMFLTCGIFYSYYTNKSQLLYLIGKIVASAIWAIFIIGLFPLEIKGMNFIKKIGKASLEIYLLHGVIIQVLSEKLLQVNALIILGLSFGLSIGAGTIIILTKEYLIHYGRLLK